MLFLLPIAAGICWGGEAGRSVMPCRSLSKTRHRKLYHGGPKKTECSSGVVMGNFRVGEKGTNEAGRLCIIDWRGDSRFAREQVLTYLILP